MSYVTKSGLAAAALLAAGTLIGAAAAQAQNTVTPASPNTAAAPAAPAGSGSTGTATKPRRGANGVEQRIADLHKRLQITPAQESQWQQVADVMRQNAKDVEAAIKERNQNVKTMNAVDDLRSYEKISEVHEDGMKRLIPVFQTLYDGMSDAQKKNADTVFRAQQRRATRAGKASKAS